MAPEQAAETLGAHGPDGIVSFVDEHIEDAAALAQRLGLRYHTPEVALSVVDKRVQRTLAADAGIPGPDFRVVPPGASKEQVAQLASEVGFPVVLKPAGEARAVAFNKRVRMRSCSLFWRARKAAASKESSRSCFLTIRPGTPPSPATFPWRAWCPTAGSVTLR